MPWKHFAADGGFKVWKIDAEGKKVGAPLSKKPMTEEAAKNQVRALYASEKKPKKEAVFISGDSTTVSATVTGDIENPTVTWKEVPNGDWQSLMNDQEQTETKDYYDEEPAIAMQMPMTGPLTFADLMAQEEAQEQAEHMHDLTYKFQMLAGNIMASDTENKAAALSALATEYSDMMKACMAGEMEDKAALIAKQIAGDNQPNEDKAKLEAAAINDLPDSDFLYIEPGGKKVDGKTEPRSLRHLPVPDTAHVRNAITRLSQSDTGTSGGEKWLTADLRKTLLAKAQKMLKADKKELFIWKEADTYRWLAAYSNNRRDEDNPPEIISSQSHKEFDEALQKGEWPMPELWIWHVPMAVGQTLFHAYDESKGFPIAGGIFNKGFEWVAEGLMEAGWDGVSHGMPSEWIQRDKEDATIITRHRTKEVSILPNWAAANKLAFTIISKENDMADETKDLPQHKRDELVAAFGEDKAKLFEAAVADKAKQADEAQIEQKEAGTPAEADKPLTQADLLKALEFVSDGIKTALGNLDTRLKAIEEAQVEEKDAFDIIERLKAKSIIGKESAKIDGRSSLAKDAPKEAEQPSFTQQQAGIRVSLVDQFVQANEAWYNGGGK